MNDEGEVRLDSLKDGQEFAMFLEGLEHLPSPCRWRFGRLVYKGQGSCLVDVTQAPRWDGLNPDVGLQRWAPETPVFPMEAELEEGGTSA